MIQWLKNFFAGFNFHTLLHAITIVIVIIAAWKIYEIAGHSKKLEKMEQEQAKLKEGIAAIERQSVKDNQHYDSVNVVNKHRVDSVNQAMAKGFNTINIINKKLDKLGDVFKANHVDLPDPDK